MNFSVTKIEVTNVLKKLFTVVFVIVYVIVYMKYSVLRNNNRFLQKSSRKFKEQLKTFEILKTTKKNL